MIWKKEVAQFSFQLARGFGFRKTNTGLVMQEYEHGRPFFNVYFVTFLSTITKSMKIQYMK